MMHQFCLILIFAVSVYSQDCTYCSPGFGTKSICKTYPDPTKDTQICGSDGLKYSTLCVFNCWRNCKPSLFIRSCGTSCSVPPINGQCAPPTTTTTTTRATTTTTRPTTTTTKATTTTPMSTTELTPDQEECSMACFGTCLAPTSTDKVHCLAPNIYDLGSFDTKCLYDCNKNCFSDLAGIEAQKCLPYTGEDSYLGCTDETVVGETCPA